MTANRIQTYLQALEVSGTFYCRSDLHGPWGIDFPAFESSAMFHLVTEGRMWLEAEGPKGRWIEAGDFVLMPLGNGHTIRSEPAAPSKSLFAHERVLLSPRCEVLRTSGDGASTMLMCGVVQLEHPGARRLIASLPSVVHIRGVDSQPLRMLIELIAREAQADGPGSFSVLTKLADVLIIQSIRHWLENEPSSGGWLVALTDDRIGKALEAIHQAPEQPWTVEMLADQAAMSRAAFSNRFTSLVGETVIAYLTRWRMDLAARRLGAENVTIGRLAFELGYESETSFSLAFKRVTGMAPGAYRKRARSEPSIATDVAPQ
jgi:AraC-like DNA-binding protein